MELNSGRKHRHHKSVLECMCGHEYSRAPIIALPSSKLIMLAIVRYDHCASLIPLIRISHRTATVHCSSGLCCTFRVEISAEKRHFWFVFISLTAVYDKQTGSRTSTTAA